MHSMRVRDVILVAAALVCCLAWWSHENSLQYKEIFKIPIHNTAAQPLTEKHAYIMPEPVLISIPNSHISKVEEELPKEAETEERLLILASAPDVLEVYDLNILVSMSLSSNRFSAYKNTRQRANKKVTARTQEAVRYRLHLSSTIIATIANVESIDSTTMGGTTTTTTTTVHSETHLYVLTSDYTLHAYTLTPEPVLRWQTRVAEKNANDFEPTHAGLQVMHPGIRHTDKGAVFVAVEVNDENNILDQHSILYAAFHSSDGELRWRVLSHQDNTINDELNERNFATSSDKVDVLNLFSDVNVKSDFEVKDVERKSSNDKLHEEVQDKKNDEKEKKEHHAEITDALRYAQHWTRFRTELLQSLPHFYTHVWDEHVELQHFSHDSHSTHNDEHLRTQFVNINTNKDEQLASSEEEKEETLLLHSPNVLVYHGAHGIEVIHLYTGYILTKLYPLKPHYVYYQNINDDKWIDGLTIKCTWPTEDDKSIHYKRIEDLQIQECMAVGFTGVPENEVEVLHVSIDEPSYSAFSLKSIHKSLSQYHHYLYRPDDKYSNVRAINQPHMMRANTHDKAHLVHDRNSFSAQSITTVQTFAKTTEPIWSELYVHDYHSRESDYKSAMHKWSHSLIVVMSESGLLTCVNVIDKNVIWQTRTAGPLLQKIMWSWLAQQSEKYIRSDKVQETNVGVIDKRKTLQHTIPYVHLTPFSVLSSDTLYDEVQHSFVRFSSKRSREERREVKDEEQQQKEENEKIEQAVLQSDENGRRYHEHLHFFRRERAHHYDYVLAVRDQYLTFVNVHSGNVVSSLELSETPITPILVADLDRDGISDLLVVTDRYVIGVCGRIEPTSICMHYTMFIVLLLLIVLVVMWEYKRQRQFMRGRLHDTNNLAKPKNTQSMPHSDLSKRAHD